MRMLPLVASLLLAGTAHAAGGVQFVEPKDGAAVAQEFTVVMAVDGMAIKPAGDASDQTGHHHLIIDAGPMPAGEVIPADATHLHFGKGQTETALKLAPGKHRLTLQFADGAHKSYGPDWSQTITVDVQ